VLPDSPNLGQPIAEIVPAPYPVMTVTALLPGYR